jgi:hypothetical protein
MTIPNEPADPYAPLRELSHERFHLLWQGAKQGAEFQDDDKLLVQAMREHPEYYDVWEHSNEFLQETVTVDGVNPFLHVTMHSIVESQAAQNRPPEVRALLAHRAAQKKQRHDTVHEIATVFATLLWSLLHDHKQFDGEAYRRNLGKLLPRRRGMPAADGWQQNPPAAGDV